MPLAATSLTNPAFFIHVSPSAPSELAVSRIRTYPCAKTLSVNMVAGLRLVAAQCAVAQSTKNVRNHTSCVSPLISFRRVPDRPFVWSPTQVNESGTDA